MGGIRSAMTAHSAAESYSETFLFHGMAGTLHTWKSKKNMGQNKTGILAMENGQARQSIIYTLLFIVC
jgi:hypothetical protein